MINRQTRLRLSIIIPTVILWLTANLYYFWVKIAGRIFLVTGTFENFNVGWAAFVHYTKGTWQQREDTLLLDFKGGKPELLDEKIIVKDSHLFKIQTGTLTPTYYYLGHCKGLN